MVLSSRIVDIPRGHRPQPQLTGQGRQLAEVLFIPGAEVILEFDEEVLGAEDTGIASGGPQGLLSFTLKEQAGYLAFPAPGEAKEATAVLAQDLTGKRRAALVSV